MTTETAPPNPPPEEAKKSRKPKLAPVRNITKGPICEWPNGNRTIIEPGRIGLVAEDRVEVLGKQVEPATAEELAAQTKADEARK